MRTAAGLVIALTASTLAARAEDRTTFWRLSTLQTNVIVSAHAGGTLSWSNAAPGRTDQVQRATLLAPANWRDYVLIPATGAAVSAWVFDPNPPPGMALIPAGLFGMGDHWGEGSADELPVHPVHVSAFHMDRHPVTKALWDAVRSWGVSNGYAFDNAGSGKGTNHPVQNVNWFDSVKWCNARSQMEGRTPAYYTDVGFSDVYKTGRAVPRVDWSAGGYRLPTEAEWEKAARGGANTNRLAWWDTNTIDHTRANYHGYSAIHTFDRGYYGYDTNYTPGGRPYTSPVGAFEAGKNGYDLHDMAGNVWEWCWDWYDRAWYGHADATAADTRGPTSGAYRVVRGGAWSYYAWGCRAAYRISHYPSFAWSNMGFRTVLSVEP